MNEQHVEAKIRSIRSALHANIRLENSYADLAELFLMRNMAGQAIAFNWMAKKVCGENDKLLRMEQAALKLKKGIHDSAATKKTVLGFTVVRLIGVGWEGAAYLVRDDHGKKWIVKALHQTEVNLINYKGLGGVSRLPLPSCQQDLFNLSAASQQHDRPKSIYPLDLLTLDQQIVGIKYPYERLWPIDKKLEQYTSIRFSLLSAFCELQAFLIKNCRLILSDPVDNFMFNGKGCFRYIDYGRSIVSIDDFRCTEDHLDAFIFFRFLFGIVGLSESLKAKMREVFYSSRYNQVLFEQLNMKVQNDVNLKKIMAAIDCTDPDLFHSADFYERCAHVFSKAASRFGTKYCISTSLLKRYTRQILCKINGRCKQAGSAGS